MSNFESMAKRTFAGPPMPEDIEAPLNAVDGRTLRKTGRTVQLATVVTADFKQWLKMELAKTGKSMEGGMSEQKRSKQLNIKVTEDCLVAFEALVKALLATKADLFEDMVAGKLEELERQGLKVEV